MRFSVLSLELLYCDQYDNQWAVTQYTHYEQVLMTNLNRHNLKLSGTVTNTSTVQTHRDYGAENIGLCYLYLGNVKLFMYLIIAMAVQNLSLTQRNTCRKSGNRVDDTQHTLTGNFTVFLLTTKIPGSVLTT